MYILKIFRLQRGVIKNPNFAIAIFCYNAKCIVLKFILISTLDFPFAVTAKTVDQWKNTDWLKHLILCHYKIRSQYKVCNSYSFTYRFMSSQPYYVKIPVATHHLNIARVPKQTVYYDINNLRQTNNKHTYQHYTTIISRN